MRILARERENEKQQKKQTRKNPIPRRHGQRQQKAHFGGLLFSLRLKHHDCGNVTKTKTGETRRGPPGSTIIILKEIIRFNNNNNNNNNHYPTIPWDGISRHGTPLSEGFFPHFVGGIHHPKSLLLSPYPAIPPYVVRTPHPGITDDRVTTGCPANHMSPDERG